MFYHQVSRTGSVHCALCGATDNLSAQDCPSRIDAAGFLRTLEGVRVGDLFIRRSVYRFGSHGASEEVVSCTKVTPKMADIGGYRYRIRDADPHGGGVYSRAPMLMPYEEARATKLQLKAEHRRKAGILNCTRWNDLPPDIVSQAYELITVKDKEDAKSE